MEYVQGGELFAKIASQKGKQFTEDQAAVYIKQLFGALNHMHSQGVAHRDIKPNNMLIKNIKLMKKFNVTE